MQWNERFHTIPRWPEYHKIISLFITSSPEISMLIYAIQICTSSTALRMATSPMMIPVCQQHYNTLGARLPTLSTFLTGRLSPPRRNLRWLLVSALFSHGRVNDPRLTPKQRPWLNLLEDSSMKIQTWWLPDDAASNENDINVCNWIWSVSYNLWGPRGQLYGIQSKSHIDITDFCRGKI